MPRSKKPIPRDLADERIRDLIPASATADQVLEDQHRLLEAYRRGQGVFTGNPPNLPSTIPDAILEPARAPTIDSPILDELKLQKKRVDEWMQDMLLPMARGLAPGVDDGRLEGLMRQDKEMVRLLKIRSRGGDTPGEAGIQGPLVQMLQRARLMKGSPVATSQQQEDDGDGE
jgi:hypothetical protein